MLDIVLHRYYQIREDGSALAHIKSPPSTSNAPASSAPPAWSQPFVFPKLPTPETTRLICKALTLGKGEEWSKPAQRLLVLAGVEPSAAEVEALEKRLHSQNIGVAAALTTDRLLKLDISDPLLQKLIRDLEPA